MPTPFSNETTLWVWEWNHAYDYWQVVKYKRGETHRATYGTMSFRTKKDAVAVCAALNSAYEAGIAYGRTSHTRCLRCDVEIPNMGVMLFVDGSPLPTEVKDSHMFCINCGSNGKNSIKSVEYHALLENRGLM